jgi:hypothetical protein
MRKGMLFDRITKEVIRQVACEDNIELETFANMWHDVYLDVFDPELFYATDSATKLPRETFDIIAPATIEKRSFFSIALPSDAFISVNGVTYSAISGMFEVSKALADRYELTLVGKYKNTTPITITVIDSMYIAKESNPRWAALRNATPTQIETWINNNVTGLTSIREVFVALLLAVRHLDARDSDD